MVAVTLVDVVGTIEYEQHIGITLCTIEVFDFRYHGTLEIHGPYDEERHVGIVSDDAGIGDNLNGRTVNEDIVVLLLQGGDELCQPLVVEKFRRIRGNGTYRYNGEIGNLLIGIFHIVESTLSDEVIGDANLGFPDETG